MLKAGEGARDVSEVFVSYHEASAGELAQTIADKLEEAGISCWCARRDMPFGGDFARTIPGQIDACKVFLLLLNENAYHSDHIESEVGLAFSRRNKKRNLRILPVEIGDFTRRDWIEYYLIHTQSVKFPENPDARQIRELVNRIADLLGNPAPAKIVKSGKCGDNVTYTLDENDVLTISGTGAMQDFAQDWIINIANIPWWNEHETISHVEIQDGVTAIGQGSFYGCTGLTSVTIPDSVNIIGDWAFSDCKGLTNITIPNKVMCIALGAFYHCARLRSVTIPNGITKIGNRVFYGCAGLTSVTIPDSVTRIENGAFDGCAGLTNVTIPDSVTTIERGAFSNCGLISVTIPDSVTEIGPYTFYRCIKLTNVTIPNSVTSIKGDAFYRCDKLTSVSVPEKATIHPDAFPATTRVIRRPSPPR